ncbi:MAG: TIGR04086 family membrane protein [Tissierellaceae bacterium]|nr:TIGR04086 family membrane protein [Tissierellaceae bacterium]
MKGNNLIKLIYLGKGLILSFIITGVSILVFSVLLAYTKIGEGIIPLVNTIVLMLSIAIGSIYLSAKIKEKGWINGGILGIAYYLILLILGLGFVRPMLSEVFLVSRLIISAVSGVIGGIIGINIS